MNVAYRTVLALILTLAACTGRPAPSSNLPEPSHAPEAELFYAQHTQAAAEAELQNAKLAATQAAGTSIAGALATQGEIDRQYTATAVAVNYTETAKADIRTAEALAESHAGTATSGYHTQVAIGAMGTATKSVRLTETAHQAIQVEREERQARSTELFWTWILPAIVTIIFASLVALGWRFARAYERRKFNVIERGPHDAPIVLLDQKPDLSEYLPSFLRPAAWLASAHTVIVDPDRSAGPVTVVENGSASAPVMASPALQDRVTERDQALDVTRAIVSGQGGRALRPPAPPPISTVNGNGNPGLVIEAPYRVVSPGADQVGPWLEDVRRQLTTGADGIGEGE